MELQLELDNLVALRVLGRGATGTVFLVSDRASPPFALKVIDKSSPAARPDAERRARWELSVLSRLHHPFLPSLLGFLESPSLLAYALPFCPAGDLNALRRSLPDSVFSPSAIRFYLSELLLAIAHLHSLSIAYRDLKPENVLIAANGHVVLSDFDLSRQFSPLSPPPPLVTTTPSLSHRLKKVRVSPVSRRNAGRSRSFVGTEEYVAPEIVRGDGHDLCVDFWALGILAYEMAYGRTPFKGRNRKETYRNVLTRELEFAGPQRTELTDLIGELLVKDPSRRLGSVGGAEEGMGHGFFKGVRWDLLGDVGRPPHFASAEELDEAAAAPASEAGGFDIRKYFEKIRSPVAAAPPDSPLAEF